LSFVSIWLETDCNGHGTHVAGTIGGQTFGISRDATLVAVKVLDCEGSGSYDAVISGIEWMVKDATTRKTSSTASTRRPPLSQIRKYHF
jgi:hypothetical protein